MKRNFPFLVLLAFLLSGFFLGNKSQNDPAGIDTSPNAVEKFSAPQGGSVDDNRSLSRWFALDVRNGLLVKGFLNSGTVTTISPNTLPAYGGDFANGKWYIVDTNKALKTVDTTTGGFTTVATVTGLPAGTNVSGLAWDFSTSTMYLSGLAGGTATLYTLNLVTGAATSVGTITTGTVIDISCSNGGQLWGIKFSTSGNDSSIKINKLTGAQTNAYNLGVNVAFAHGMDFDPATDSLFHWGYIGSGVNNLYRIDQTTGAAQLITSLPSGEYDACGIPGTPPTPVGNSTLVLLHDSTVTTGLAKRKADRDTLLKYLPQLISGYDVAYFTETSTLPSLTQYKTIICMETDYDNSGALALGAAARTSLKAWINSGTASDKKAFLHIGGDLGWVYSRSSTHPQRDTVLSNVLGGYIYRVDDATNGTAPFSITGIGVDAGNVRPMTDEPPASDFYPDGCLPNNGAVVLYNYTGHSATDTVGAVARNQTGYVTVSSFQSPRYFINGSFKNVLQALVGYIRTNGGTITSVGGEFVNNNVSEYSLSQNYPNPFNPSTRISFSLPKAGVVSLKVYNILGKEVASLVNEFKATGTHTVEFNASRLSSGTYFYRIETEGFVQVKKMLLVK